MVIGSWQFNTIVTILFVSTSLALVQRCDKDRFCEKGYDRSLLIERDDLSGKEQGWNVQRRNNLLDERLENNWRSTGREDITQDQIQRRREDRISDSRVRRSNDLNRNQDERLSQGRSDITVVSIGRHDTREDARVLGKRGESRSQAERRHADRLEGMTFRADRSKRTSSRLERSESTEDRRQDSRQQDNSREKQIRFEDATEKRKERIKEETSQQVDFCERDLDRVRAQRGEDCRHSEASNLVKFHTRRERDSQRDGRQEINTRHQISRDNRARSDDSTEPHEDRVRETLLANRRERPFDRLSKQRFEDLTGSEDRQKDSWERVDHKDSRRVITRREQTIRTNQRDGNSDRSIDRTEHTDQVEARRDISRESRNRLNDATERPEGRNSESDRLDRPLHRLSNRRYNGFSQSDGRRENSVKRVNRGENIHSLRRDDSRNHDTNRLKERTDRVNPQIAREKRDRLNDAIERHEERDSDQLHRTAARRAEKTRETDRSGRLERVARSQGFETISVDRREHALNRKADEHREERAAPQRREERLDRPERLETSAREFLVPITGERDSLERSMTHQAERINEKRHSNDGVLNIRDEHLQATGRKLTDRDDRSRREVYQEKTGHREEFPKTPRNNHRKTSTDNTDYQVDDAMDYVQTFAKYAKPSLLTAIQGTLLAVVITKSLSADNTKFGNGIIFKAMKLTGSTETLI